MSLIDLLKGLFHLRKKVDVKKLPSQGIFYNDDFKIFIKKAKYEDILEYEKSYIKEELGYIVNKIKRVVEKNSVFSSGYEFSDIKSIDVLFLFLEIVKFTKGKEINIQYFDEESGEENSIEFSSQNFNYFTLSEEILKKYDSLKKEFNIEGFKFSLPSIGVENCTTNYLISKSCDEDAIKYNEYNYDFMFFLGNKKNITFIEIENLIQIFNEDIDIEDSKKIKKILKIFQPIQRYSLISGKKIIEMTSKIDLEKIWR